MNGRTQATHRRGVTLRFPLLALLISVGATLLVFAGCGLNTHGAGTGGNGGEGGTVSCNDDSQCNDKNPCTVDSCGPDKTCVFTAVDGKPAPDDAQTAGDCKTIQCVAGKPKDEPESGDVPDDDEDCTIDGCNADGPYHTGKPEDTPCDKSGKAGVCKSAKCTVVCTTSDDCKTDNPCETGKCNGETGTCDFEHVTDGTPTPGVTQAPGDCHQRICLNGVDTDQVDDSDVPLTPTDCDTEVCTNGTPSNPAKPLNNTCSTFGAGMPGFCDGNGTCRECAQDDECPGTKDDCQHPACVNFACSTSFTPDMTPVKTQNPGDCQQIVCDGAGGTKSIVDDGDKPVDATVCTNDICTNGVPSNTPNPGVACETASSPFVCNAAGQCGCKSNTDCTAPNTCGGGNPGTAGVCGCTKTTCAAEGVTCGTISDACFGNLNCDNGAKNGGETDVDCGGPTSGCATRCGNGKKCSAGSDCASGFCVDGVCCNSACGGTCNACSAAKKGQGSDGLCGAIKIGTDPDNECNDQGATSCGTTGSCDGAGACQLYAAGTVCRAANGACDVQEVCPGNGAPCPNDAFAPSTTVCRNAAGACDVAESCTGTGPNCPADGFAPNTTVCRPSAGACDVAEKCPGNNANCPADGFMPNSTVCRAAVDMCDVAEKCPGNGANCPADGFAPSTTTCRASAGPCDVAEKCSGTGAGCPADAFASSSTVCRNAAGPCDVAETCTGSSASCPADVLAPNGTVCRASAGACDVAETCNGSSANCPADGFLSNTTVCRPSAGACDVAEKCPGNNANCPNDAFLPSSTVCRAAVDACDVAEKCPGNGADCPTDAFAPSTTVCMAGSCTSGNETDPSMCDGAGTCVPGLMSSCGAYACGPTACLTACGNADAAGDGKCASNYYCDGVSGGACQPQKISGKDCTRDGECTSGKCVSGTSKCM